MKSSLISLAVLSALSHSAVAVSVSAQGRGEALVFPYYTTEAGLSTNLQVRNHSDSAKALVVRFRESRNGRTVMEFHAYLGKRDTWQATVFSTDPAPGSDAPAAVYTTDDSCTVPGIRSGITFLPTLPNGERFVSFRNFAYTGSSADGGPAGLGRTRSGFIEVIEMASLTPGSTSEEAANEPYHNNCITLEQAWGLSGYWSVNPNVHIEAPNGGLSGTAQIIDVAAGSLATYNATALANLRTVAQHTGPGSGAVTLASRVQDPVDPLVTSTVHVDGGAVTSSWPRQRAFEAVSAALSAASVGNRYVVGAARTEWVLSFPTKHFHTDPAQVSTVVAPFTQLFAANAPAMAQSCDTAQVDAFGKDGQAASVHGPSAVSLCGATQVLGFAADNGARPGNLLGARDRFLVSTGSHLEGMAELDLSSFSSAPAVAGESWSGLPVIALALWRVGSIAQPGFIQGSAEHGRAVSCTDCE